MTEDEAVAEAIRQSETPAPGSHNDFAGNGSNEVNDDDEDEGMES